MSDPRYPGHSDEFVRIMDASGLGDGEAQNRVRAMESGVTDLMNVKDDELVMLHRIGTNHYDLPGLDISRRDIEVEVARRNIDAANRNAAAVNELRTSVDMLHTTTQAASASTSEALRDLRDSINDLRNATDKWSTWLVRLTIGIFGLTLLLAALAIAQVVNR